MAYWWETNAAPDERFWRKITDRRDVDAEQKDPDGVG
jgi:hypothetical protein